MDAILVSQPGDADVLQLSQAPTPTPGPGMVRIKVAAVGLNRADLLQRRGLYPPPKGTPANILGLEYAGEIESLGEGSSLWEVGDRVMGLVPGASYAEYVVVHEREVLPIPGSMAFEDAAAIPEAFLTAYDAVHLQGDLRAGQSVLIHAMASGVGTAAVQLARAAGAASFGTTRSAWKIDSCKELGVAPDVAIHAKDRNFADVVLQMGEGVNVVLDLVGGSYLADNVRAVKKRGRILVVGLVGGIDANLSLRSILRKRISITGSALRSRPIEEKIQLAQHATERLIPLFERGHLKPIVHSTFSMRDAAQAHRSMESNENVGKIVLTW